MGPTSQTRLRDVNYGTSSDTRHLCVLSLFFSKCYNNNATPKIAKNTLSLTSTNLSNFTPIRFFLPKSLFPLFLLRFFYVCVECGRLGILPWISNPFPSHFLSLGSSQKWFLKSGSRVLFHNDRFSIDGRWGFVFGTIGFHRLPVSSAIGL